MELRSFVTFDAPSLEELDRSDECPAGRQLAHLLSELLSRRGLDILEPVEQHESYGWYFVVAGARQQAVWCMLQLSDTWLLITKAELSLLKRLMGRRVDREAHRRVCEAIHAAASERADVTNVCWFTEREFRTKAVGAREP